MSFEAASAWRDLCRALAEEPPLRSSSTRGCVHRRDQVSGCRHEAFTVQLKWMRHRQVDVYLFTDSKTFDFLSFDCIFLLPFSKLMWNSIEAANQLILPFLISSACSSTMDYIFRLIAYRFTVLLVVFFFLLVLPFLGYENGENGRTNIRDSKIFSPKLTLIYHPPG